MLDYGDCISVQAKVLAVPPLWIILCIFIDCFLERHGEADRQTGEANTTFCEPSPVRANRGEEPGKVEGLIFPTEAQGAWWPSCSSHSCYGNRKVKLWLLRDTERRQSPSLLVILLWDSEIHFKQGWVSKTPFKGWLQLTLWLAVFVFKESF